MSSSKMDQRQTIGVLGMLLELCFSDGHADRTPHCARWPKRGRHTTTFVYGR